MIGFVEQSTGVILGGGSRATSPVSRPATAERDWEEGSFGVLGRDPTGVNASLMDAPQHKREQWEGRAGSAPIHVEKWRYFRVRINKLVAARHYSIQLTGKQSLFEM